MLTSPQIVRISMQTITTVPTPGHRPQQLILELGGENKPVYWLRDISTLIVLIGSKLKYASMVQEVLFPFLSLIELLPLTIIILLLNKYTLSKCNADLIGYCIVCMECINKDVLFISFLFFPPSCNYQLSNNLRLLYLLS